MGRNKALLPFRGKRLIDHVAQVLNELLRSEDLCVSGEVEGFHCIRDRVAVAGPLAGLAAVADENPDQWLLVVPVDMGALTSGVLQALLSARDQNPHQKAFRFSDYELPLLFYSDSVSRGHLATLLQPETPAALRSLREWCRILGCCEVSCPQERLSQFQNTNTPEEWVQFQKGAESCESQMG